ncbi:MAG TPA: acetyl-CoA carboxylase biotin carboxyl carrier protein [Terriglobia bacterium]|nr:acetyl-CoA carboxylase biotin carboxyl carrier protein [Terriglobia bacterium]
MNLKELKEVIEIFISRDSIEELEIEKSGVRLRMKRAGAAPVQPAGIVYAAPPVQAAPPPSTVSASGPVETAADDLVYVKSPIVGTFYRASSPTEKPFVSVGDHVEKGAVLCIIEAMKLMNEIDSEVAGEVVAVLVENGQAVEYGQRLFSIRPR